MTQSAREGIKRTELEMTPMIDIVFLLIAFFMLVTEIGRQDDIEDLRLPAVRASVPVEPQCGPLIINIKSNGIVVIGGTEYDLDVPADAASVRRCLRREAALRRAPTGTPDRTVLVRADERTPFRFIRRIIALCVDRDIGLWRLAFGAAPRDRGAQDPR